MSFVIQYIKKYKIRAILAPLFKMLEAIFELLVPLVMASIINKGIASSDTHYIIRMSGVLLLLAVIGLVFSITAQYFSAYVAVYAASEIRHDLFSKIMSLSQGTKEKIGDEVLTTRITNDINQIQNAINMVLRLFLRSPFIVAGATIMAFIVDVKSALTFLVVVGLLSAIVFFIMKYTLPRYKTIAARLEKVLHATSENLEGARVLRAFNQVDNEKKEFENRTGELAQMQVSTGKISALLNPVTYVVVNLGIVLLVYVAMGRVDDNYILQGDVVALVNYMSQILIELIKLANLIVLLMKAFPSADRVKELMEMKSDERIHLNSEKIVPAENAGSIQISNVSFSYNGTNDYDLENISINIPAGSVLGIIGGTGSGKSTLLKLMNHTYDSSEGQITIDGVDVKKLTDGELSILFGIVPQKASLFSGTIRSNMTMKNLEANDTEIKTALNIAQAMDFVETKEGVIDAEVSGKGTNFSGGQRQRLTIARALIGRPRILILDDSASALDLATEARLRKALYSLDWKPTIIMVSQRASSVMDADQILVLDDGKCVGLGTHRQLLENCETYQEIYYCQYPREEASNE